MSFTKNHKKIRKIVGSGFRLVLLLLALTQVLGWLDDLTFVTFAFAVLRPHLWWLFGTCAVIYFLYQRSVASFAYIFLWLFSFIFVGGWVIRPAPTSANTSVTPIRILVANVFSENEQPELLAQTLAHTRCDVMVLPEYRSNTNSRIIEQVLSSTMVRLPCPHYHDVGIFIRKEFYREHAQDMTWQPVSEFSMPGRAHVLPNVLLIGVQFDLYLKDWPMPVRVMGIHPISPGRPEFLKAQTRQYDFLYEYVETFNTDDVAVIVAGDFNAVPWVRRMRKLCDRGKLQVMQAGARMYPTWPSWGLQFARVPIDHVLCEKNVLQSRVVEVVTLPGSDHLGVCVEVWPNVQP